MLAQSTFHGNVTRTGAYQAAGPTRFGGVQWAFNTGGPIVSSPAIVDRVVYIASFSGHLFAIDQQTGRLRWNFDAKSYIFSSAALAGDLAFVGSMDGNLYALN